MDELEHRIAALEAAFYEVMAWIGPEALDDAARSIRAGLCASIDGDERTVREGALHLIELARNRFDRLSGAMGPARV